ncbi:MAG: 3-isopropylmalate dehydratase small subunit [Spirochaetales bacterium]|nr:3-isopropylmalate dehydratase small subunit [Spirochaetales bacterium]
MANDDVKKIRIEGRGVYVPGDDIDTDQIIPARFMRCVTFDGLGKYAFYDVRFNADETPKEHPLNEEIYAAANILLSNNNFGCGSSREHAPQALKRFGFDAFIAESFAEIFAGNCATLGLPAVSVKKSAVENLAAKIQKSPQIKVVISLMDKTIECDGEIFSFTMPESHRQSLINGTWDTVFELQKNDAEVEATLSSLPYSKGFK